VGPRHEPGGSQRFAGAAGHAHHGVGRRDAAYGQLAITHRLPPVSGARQYAEGGAHLSYGVNAAALYGRAARYVDKILKGAKPGDLPIEQPAQFDLVINMKTARALGLTIPPSLLLRADQVIE
jgi:putative tryptophan/tyrosine transport system substrate-binding protein